MGSSISKMRSMPIPKPLKNNETIDSRVERERGWMTELPDIEEWVCAFCGNHNETKKRCSTCGADRYEG